MSKRDDRKSLEDMLDHAREAINILADASLDDLMSNRMMQLALQKLEEVLGKAANRVSEETGQQHAAIAWREIIGTRNRLVYDYNYVDLDVLRDTITEDLPPLIGQLVAIVEEGQ